MQGTQTPKRWLAPLIIVGALLIQVITHLAWLPISAQVGPVATPWFMSQGLPLFARVIQNYPPAIGALLSLLYRLLPSVEPIYILRALNLLLTLGLTLLIYDLARRLSGSMLAGICALLFWVLWEPVYANIMFYFDTLMGATFALTVWVWLITEKRRPGWLAPLVCGLLLGGATLFKQPAWGGVILFGLWLVIAARRVRQFPAFVIGALGFPLLTAGIFAAQGTLDSYWFWNYHVYLIGIPDPSPLTGDLLRKFLLTEMLVPAFILQTLRHPKAQNYWLVLALWLAGGATLLPGWGEIHGMAHLPLLAVLSGAAIAPALDVRSAACAARAGFGRPAVDRWCWWGWRWRWRLAGAGRLPPLTCRGRSASPKSRPTTNFARSRRMSSPSASRGIHCGCCRCRMATPICTRSPGCCRRGCGFRVTRCFWTNRASPKSCWPI